MPSLEFNQLSRIGLGTYHMSVNIPQHVQALKYAVKCGCNLIDTAANYANGNSEKLTGSFISEHPGKKIFVITKAGYVSSGDYNYIKKVMGKKSVKPIIGRFGENVQCIQPDFLRYKIRNSLNKLNRKYLDGFLLHNPEYFLMASASKIASAKFNKMIRHAFEFLEECVEKGIIRYYGISSNTFAVKENKKADIGLAEMIGLANSVSSNHSFRIVQLPYNFSEKQATDNSVTGRSFLELASDNDIRVFSNRPLNMQDADGNFLRFAHYRQKLSKEEEVKANDTLGEFLDMINRRLIKLNFSENARNFEIINQIISHWRTIGNQSSVYILFYDYLRPFLNTLYNNTIADRQLISPEMTRKEQSNITRLYQYSLKYSEITMSLKCQTFVGGLLKKGILIPEDKRSYPVQACDYYLRSGINHVLAGMRSKKYVDDLKILF